MVRVFFTALLLNVRKMKKKKWKVRACFISMMRAKICTDCWHYRGHSGAAVRHFRTKSGATMSTPTQLQQGQLEIKSKCSDSARLAKVIASIRISRPMHLHIYFCRTKSLCSFIDESYIDLFFHTSSISFSYTTVSNFMMKMFRNTLGHEV